MNLAIAANGQPQLIEVDPHINVVFGSDRAFLPYTAVALQSLITAYTDKRPLRVFLLLADPLGEEDRARFAELQSIRRFELREILVDASRFRNIRTTAGISVATYYRLYMHLLLPEQAKRAIWLDGDIIVRKCISGLFDADIGNALFGGVEDSHSALYRRRFGVHESAANVNCGVLLVNLELLREVPFLPEIDAFLKSHGHKIMLGDQQILNTLFHEQIAYVPLHWNVHGRLLDRNWVLKNRHLNSLSMRAIEAALKRPSIVHYCGNIKPWNSGARQLATQEWRSAAAISPYRENFEGIPATGGRRRKLQHIIGRFVWKLGDRHRQWKKLRRFARTTQLPAVAYDHELLNRSLRSHMYIALTERRRQIGSRPFSADQLLSSLPEMSAIALVGNNEDVTGGFHENLKPMFRTPHIGTHIQPHAADACLFLLQNLRHLRHWDCMRASHMGTPLIFGETSFFGAYAGYYDRSASAHERRCFGYIFDDLGYYFDANQPSRLETILNDPGFELSAAMFWRARALIDRVRTERVTKYNKYVRNGGAAIEPGSVIVVEQRPQDASIIFGAAGGHSFQNMLCAAVAENPDRLVYIKRHPDNIHNRTGTLKHHRARVLPDDFDVTAALDECRSVYTVTSQVGFEALLRGKDVVTFGLPFYAGWGLTDDRMKIARRMQKRSIEELFHVACINLSAYVNPMTGQLMQIEDAFDYIRILRSRGDAL